MSKMRGGWVGDAGDIGAAPELLSVPVGRPALMLWMDDRRLAPSVIVVDFGDELLLGLLGVLIGRDISAAAMSHSSSVHKAILRGVSVLSLNRIGVVTGN